MSDFPTYWIARHDAPDFLHRISVYAEPPRWIERDQRWSSADGRTVCTIESEPNARALLGIEEIPRLGRCIRVEIVELEQAYQFPIWRKRRVVSRREVEGHYDPDVVHHVLVRRLPWVEDVTDALRAAAKEPTT